MAIVMAAVSINWTMIILAMIGLPVNFLLALATYRKARSADQAVNHRASGTTISEDIADMRVEMREMRRDTLWTTQALMTHIKKDHIRRDEI